MPSVTINFSAEHAVRIKDALRDAVDLRLPFVDEPDEDGNDPVQEYREPDLNDLKDILRNYLINFVAKSEKRKAAVSEIELT